MLNALASPLCMTTQKPFAIRLIEALETCHSSLVASSFYTDSATSDAHVLLVYICLNRSAT